MKSLLIGILLAVLCYNSVSAQGRVVHGRPSPKELARLNAESERESLKNTFEHLELGRNDAKAAIDRFIIPRGDFARVKCVFDGRKTVNVAVNGGGVAAPADIRKGIFETKVSPKKTSWVGVNVDATNSYNGRTSTTKLGFRIIVVDPEKYDSIMAVYNSLPAGQRRSEFTDSLAGGSFRDFRLGKIK